MMSHFTKPGQTVPSSNQAPSEKALKETIHINPDKEFVQLANQLVEALCQVELSGRQYRVFMTIVRKTLGFRKATDWLTVPQLADMMHYRSDYRKLYRDLSILKTRGLLIREGKNIGINTHLSQWSFTKPKNHDTLSKVPQTSHLPPWSPKMEHNTPAIGPKNFPKQVTTKEKKHLSKERLTPCKTLPPEHFVITRELEDWARQRQISADLTFETEQFLDYFRAKGEKRLDWVASWRNWMRRLPGYSPPPQKTQCPQKKPAIQTHLELAQQGLRNHQHLLSDDELQSRLAPNHPCHEWALDMHAQRQDIRTRIQALQQQSKESVHEYTR